MLMIFLGVMQPQLIIINFKKYEHVKKAQFGQVLNLQTLIQRFMGLPTLELGVQQLTNFHVF
jgi:hypothetical protein